MRLTASCRLLLVPFAAAALFACSDDAGTDGAPVLTEVSDDPSGVGEGGDPADPDPDPGADPGAPTDPSTPDDPTDPNDPSDPTDPNDPANPPEGEGNEGQCLSEIAPPIPNVGLCTCAFADCEATTIECSCANVCALPGAPSSCQIGAGPCLADPRFNGQMADYIQAFCGGSGQLDCVTPEGGGDMQCTVVGCEPSEIVTIGAPEGVDTTECFGYEGVCNEQDGPIELARVIAWEPLGEENEDVICVRASLHEDIADNTWGANKSDTWEKPKRDFEQLVKSDHLEILLQTADGATLCDAKFDLISADASAPSGYSSLGPWGGDGTFLDCPEDAIVSATSSTDYNMNVLGCTDTVDSPDPADCEDCPEWESAYWWEVCYDKSVLGINDASEIMVTFPYLHASPAKCGVGDTIIEIVQYDCSEDPDPEDPPPPGEGDGAYD